MGPPYTRPIDVLVLCTGNVCRSPMAEAVLADLLGRRGVDATVHSAGLLFDDRPAEDHAVAVMAERGLDISGHRSRVMTVEMLEATDLLLGMERRHVREAAMLAPAVWPRSFTLKEVVRRAAPVGPRADDTDVADWLGEVAGGRTHADHLGELGSDLVEDPMGRARRHFRRAADEIVTASGQLVDLLYPRPEAPSVPAD